MKKLASLVLVLMVAAGAAALVAGEKNAPVTVSGSMMCGHCVLHEKGLASCQDVLVVKGDGKAAESKYYVENNKVADEFGHACSGAKQVRITGTVSAKDGKEWISASKIEALEKS